MPLDTKTLTLKKRDVDISEGAMIFGAPYAWVSQHGYGRMDASSPGKGLATDGVASCIVVIFHSPTTGRTVMSHSPNFLQMLTFDPMVAWVTGGPPECIDMSHMERILFLRHSSGAPPTTLNVVVLRGFEYDDPVQAATFNHDGWMRDLRNYLSQIASARDIVVDIVDSPRTLKTGVVLVDKSTGCITHIELGSGFRAPMGPGRLRLSMTLSGIVGRQYKHAHTMQDILVAGLIQNRRIPVCPPIRLQYNVNTYRLPAPLSDEARQLIRSERLGEPDSVRSAIIKALGQPDDWVSQPTTMNFQVMKQALKITARLPPNCEKCLDVGPKKCAVCKGAWYCSEAHQKEDWKEHKKWCKTHSLPK